MGMERTTVDRKKFNIPEENNLYGEVSNFTSKTEFAKAIKIRGLSIHKTTWTDFEIECEWAWFETEGEDDGITINGVIDPKKMKDLADLINGLGYDYSLEVYDEDDELIESLSNMD